ncbi:MAG: acetyltransferase [Comamonadaceae bacterium]|nr:acetyltransferase [Comamonadaceae bacterium]
MLLFGAGGHGRVVADAALLTKSWSTIVVSDRDPARCVGPFLQGVDRIDLAIARSLTVSVHIAIGDNAAREWEASCFPTCHLVSVLHPFASVSQFSQLGAGCFVAAGAVLATGAQVGMACIVNHGAVVDHDAQLGAFCHVAPLATLGGEVILGQRVMVGAGVNILPGMRVTDDVVIGAGAVVRSDLLEPGTYVGVPARRLK